MPFFSVIIPLYNKEDHIKNTLNSVLSQTFTDFEIIIIDDGSTDNSLSIVKHFKDSRVLIYSQENSGAAKTRNNAIKKAKAKYIALTDADDFWFPNHLEEHYKSINKIPSGDLYSNAYKLKLAPSKTINATYNTPHKLEPYIIEDYFKASTIHPIAWTSAIVLSKKKLDDIGYFNEDITSGQDIDLILRFALKGTIVFNPEITCIYDKTVDNSLSKENHQTIKYKLFNSYKIEENNLPSLKKYLTLNRYSLAIQCKLAKNYKLFDKLKQEIDVNLLNQKQRFLLKSPYLIVAFFKSLHLFLVKQNIYMSSYK